MIFLILSIICSSLILIVLKGIGKYHRDRLVVITINYIVCTLLGISLLATSPSVDLKNIQSGLIGLCLFLGVLFIVVFTLMSMSAEKAGVSVTSVANKLSLVIPVSLAFWLYNDTLNILKLVGIFIALLSLIFVSYNFDKKSQQTKVSYVLLPILVFLGSGMVDVLIKFAQDQYVSGGGFHNLFLVMLFGTAASSGVIAIFIKKIRNKPVSLTWKELLWGFMLGIPNYGSIYFLVKTLEKWESSIVFPVNNVGIILCATLLALLIYKERIKRTSMIGFILAIIAILLIAFA